MIKLNANVHIFIESRHHNLALQEGYSWVAGPEAKNPAVLALEEKIKILQK